VTQARFKQILSKRAVWNAHSGVLECHALLLAVKYITSSSHKHHTRSPVLVDAKAILYAASRGLSSAPALRNMLRCIAAEALASNILLRLLYVPSEHNPSDKASRGKSLHRHVVAASRKSKPHRDMVRHLSDAMTRC